MKYIYIQITYRNSLKWYITIKTTIKINQKSRINIFVNASWNGRHISAI